MILKRSNMRGLGFTVIPGITQLTPQWVENSAALNNGMRFGVNGLRGLGSDWSEGDYNPSGWNIDSVATMVQKGMTMWNAQKVFDINLDRIQAGLAPIPTQYAAPTMNLGIAGVSSNMLLIGAGILAFLLLRK